MTDDRERGQVAHTAVVTRPQWEVTEKRVGISNTREKREQIIDIIIINHVGN